MSDVKNNELTQEEAEAYRAEVFSDDFDENAHVQQKEPVSVGAGEEATIDDTQVNVDPDSVEEAEVEIDPAVKTILDGISDKLNSIDNLNYRLKQAEGRIGSVQNAVQNNKKQEEIVKNVPTKEEILAAANSDKEWDELKEDYPDLLESLESRFASKESLSEVPSIDDMRTNLTADIDSKFVANSATVERMVESRLVDVLRPNWKDDIFDVLPGGRTQTKQEYISWYNRATPEMQDNAKSNNAVEAMQAYDNFIADRDKATSKETPEQIQARRNKRLNASQTVTGKGAPLKIKSVEDMTDSEYRVWLSQQPD